MSEYKLTSPQFQMYLDSKEGDEGLGIAGDPQESILARAYKHHYNIADILVASDTIEVNGAVVTMTQWQKNFVRWEDSEFQDQERITKQMYERMRRITSKRGGRTRKTESENEVRHNEQSADTQRRRRDFRSPGRTGTGTTS